MTRKIDGKENGKLVLELAKRERPPKSGTTKVLAVVCIDAHHDAFLRDTLVIAARRPHHHPISPLTRHPHLLGGARHSLQNLCRAEFCGHRKIWHRAGRLSRGEPRRSVLPLPIPRAPEMAFEQAVSPTPPAMFEVLLHARSFSNRDDGLFDRLPWQWNATTSSKRSGFLHAVRPRLSARRESAAISIPLAPRGDSRARVRRRHSDIRNQRGRRCRGRRAECRRRRPAAP